MRAACIVVEPPGFDEDLRLGERGELMHVQALVAEPPVKRFDKRIFHGFPWSNEVELDAASIRPIFKGSRLKLSPMIHRDGARS